MPRRPAAHPAVKLDAADTRKLDRRGNEFMAEVLRFESDRRDNVAALFELGAVLTRLGRFDEGLAIDRRLVKLQPDQPILRYNLACSLALLDQPDEALEELERAIELGYDDVNHMVHDRDLERLRDDTRFEDLVRRLRLQEQGAPPATADPE